MTIAVMGAAGNVGSKVADLLLRRGEKVRVFEHARSLERLHERGAEVVNGDACSVEDLMRLFQGASAALVVLPDVVADPEFVATRSRISRAIADALRETRVSHVVAVSTVGADCSDAAGPPAGLHELEQRLSTLEGANVLALRSGPYMDYLLANLPLIQSQRINGGAWKGDIKLPMVATQDVAQEAAERLVRCDFVGHRAKNLLGPEDLTMREATAAIGSFVGQPDLPYVEFPPEGVKQALMGAGMSEEAARLIVEMQLAVDEGRPFATVRRTAETTTPTTLQGFLSEALAGIPAAEVPAASRKDSNERDIR